ncbi:hypothetical protein K4L06_03540 [Lysobacter sp. BMK333-48F3]|uniref:hypothetical protein n=1 Tax=Lysobacter sp. BMK333-48F3 TaxID=2867962 RepID=UPI001C8B9CCD|nr:hypothetical protein [Lysobacter sp. BMK333-48F3]MBX9400370.1 hypothetical protein [Lysobacter sp. BMK333-48F3]
MTQAQAPQGGEAAADAVAAQLDRIAEQSVSRSRPSTAAVPPPPPAPPGPDLTGEAWRERILRLIDGLKTPMDTRPARVAEALGLTLVDRNGSHEANGALPGGAIYKVWVDALYRESPDKWTVGLSQVVYEGPRACLFELDSLRRHVQPLGYTGKEGWRDRAGDEHASYSRQTADGTVIALLADVITVSGQSCVRSLRIDAFKDDEAND